MSSPLNAVHIQRRRNQDFSVGCASMQGWRGEHEDSHVINTAFGSGAGAGLFGVCDGHAGSRAAAFTARRLPQLLGSVNFAQDASLVEAFLSCDAEYRKEPANSDGCTAVYCHVQRRASASASGNSGAAFELTVMNIGDSRCLLIRPSLVSPEISRDLGQSQASQASQASQSAGECSELQGFGLVFETQDHKPDVAGERARIEAAGGFVTQDDPPRLDGVIAVSRVIGDFAYKNNEELGPEQQKMSAVPDISRMQAREGDVVVIACDGLFEGMDSRELARQIVLRMHHSHDLGSVARDIVLHALNATESKDNMTLALVLLAPPATASTGDSAATAAPTSSGEGEEEEELTVGDYQLKPEQRDKYETFFRKAGFPGTPSPCDVCRRVLKHMSQCPCRGAVYCGVLCQRQAWREHKKKCPAHLKNKQQNQQNAASASYKQ